MYKYETLAPWQILDALEIPFERSNLSVYFTDDNMNMFLNRRVSQGYKLVSMSVWHTPNDLTYYHMTWEYT